MYRHVLFGLFCLLMSVNFVYGQINDSIHYDFRDGSIIAAGQSPDGQLTLSGNYSYHSAQYGLNMKVDGEIEVSVDGSSTVRFLGSEFSGLTMVGSAEESGDLGSQNTMVINDLSDTYSFMYSGFGDPLNFLLTSGSGNDLYLPVIEVIPAQAGIADTTALKDVIYYFDFRDGSIIPTNTTGLDDIHIGLVDVLVGNSNAYGYNGSQHGSILKAGNQIILDVTGNSYIKVGGSVFSTGTISVSSTDGDFDIYTQSSTTTGNYGNDGSTVDFLYVGDEGEITLDFTGTNYVPYIEVVPVPYEVNLTPWIQKSGTITINGIDIDIEAGVDASSDASVTVSQGIVVSATKDEASIRIDLEGEELASYTPAFTSGIDTVTIAGDSLLITYADSNSDPLSYLIHVADSSISVEAVPGETYQYDFADGSELPQISYQALRYITYVSQDGILTMNSNTSDEARQFGFHDATHGGVFFPGNSFDIIVAGDAIITYLVDTYGQAIDAVLEFKDQDGNVLGSIPGQNIGGDDGFPVNFAYTGPAGTLTATLLSTDFPTAEIYLHGMSIQNAPAEMESNGKADVWDFGAAELDTSLYNNRLTVDLINSWYDTSIVVGSSGNVLPDFSSGLISFTGGGNDRLRTTNMDITRYDENISSAASGFTGRIYVNSAANTGRYIGITLNEDDELTVYAKTDAGGQIHFQYVPDPDAQTDIVEIPSDFTELNFVADQAGLYRLFDSQGKPSYYRIVRNEATYADIAGSVDLTEATGISDTFQLVFTNDAGKSWYADVANDTFAASLPVGYEYELSLYGADRFIISEGAMLEVIDTTSTHDVKIVEVELYNVTGSILGLGNDIADLGLVYTADSSSDVIFQPEAIIDTMAGTYSVELEPSVLYKISATGVNDYYIPMDSVSILQADSMIDIEFIKKPVFPVVVDVDGLTDDQENDLALIFSNLNEDGYVYEFQDKNAIELRSGVYEVSTTGLDAFAVELGLTSNLKVEQDTAKKTLKFHPVTHWTFDDRDIENGDPTYKGLLFEGNVSNEQNKSHMAAKPDAKINVPVDPGQVVRVSYYYTADFWFDGVARYTTNTQSTGILEFAEYVYPADTSGYVTMSIGDSVSTTYITDIEVAMPLDYSATITVGLDKDYLTINEALDAVRRMNRPLDERVTILIDPGNYEEMLEIDMNNVTLKNASGNPSIDLLNQGVDIDPQAVRVTSYYGHGYDYYSMGNDQKWNGEVLEVNAENGYLSYENVGAGTTNGSYWNATVVVYGTGFEADHIIFENSFNQYISKKESEDIVVMWDSGSRGERPVDYGSVMVQDRSFVERAAAIAIVDFADKVILNKCRIIGRQDSFFGGRNARAVMYKGSAMGAVDYIFGGMTAVFYKTDLAMNTSDASVDRSYITAAQQAGGRGYLMYECTVTSAEPGTETASTSRSKPGYFGRPWQATTSEVVFFNTTIETSNYPGYDGLSLIEPLGWQNTLGGESSGMYEYGTVEESGTDHSAERASWSTVLTDPELNDGTQITTFNFTKGDDGWDPLPDLIAQDMSFIEEQGSVSAVQVYAYDDRLFISNVEDETLVTIYGPNGVPYRSFKTFGSTDIQMLPGYWIVVVEAPDGKKIVKVITH